MRMILPPLRQRRVIDQHLSSFFRDHKVAEFRRAVSLMCAFYRLKRPRVEWYEYLDWGKTAGKTYENGTIHLVHPENWKRGRKYNSERQWVNVVYHELGHYIYWADAERKADAFAYHMVRGLYLRRWKNRCAPVMFPVKEISINNKRDRRCESIFPVLSMRQKPLWRVDKERRRRTRTVGGLIGRKAASKPRQKSAERRPGRSSSAASKIIARSRRSKI